MGRKSFSNPLVMLNMFMALAMMETESVLKKGIRRHASIMQRLKRDHAAAMSIGPLLSIVTVIVAAVVGISLIAALMPTYLGALSDTVGVFENETTTTGNSTADGLLSIFGLLLAFAGLFAIVALAITAIRLRKGN